MLKIISVIICLISLKTFAETKLNFSGDAFVRGYFNKSTGNDDTQAFNQFFRLNIDAKPDEHLSIKTGLVLSGNTWEGDNHSSAATATGVDQNGGGGDTTRLDHAFIEYNNNNFMTSVGRMAVTSPGSFLTSDDRRDRVQVLKIEQRGFWAFVYDKRYEGVLANGRDDLDMFSVNYYGKTDHFNFALQSGYWTSNTTNTFKDLKQFTPQIDGIFLGINYNFYYTILTGGNSAPAAIYPHTHHSTALVLSKNLNDYKLSYQSILTFHGGFIAGGYDTFSSVINNSPDHHQSSIVLRFIGSGFGRDAANEQMHVVKLGTSLTPSVSATISAGFARVYVWAAIIANSKIENNQLIDATLKYSIAKNLSLDTNFGKFYGDNTNSAGSLTLNANF
jgi:hypothetical protein